LLIGGCIAFENICNCLKRFKYLNIFFYINTLK